MFPREVLAAASLVHEFSCGPSEVRLRYGDSMGAPVAATPPRTNIHQAEAGLSDQGRVGAQGGPEGS